MGKIIGKGEKGMKAKAVREILRKHLANERIREARGRQLRRLSKVEDTIAMMKKLEKKETKGS